MRKKMGLETDKESKCIIPMFSQRPAVFGGGRRELGSRKTKGCPEDGMDLCFGPLISQKVAPLHSHFLTYSTGAKSWRKHRKC